MALAKCPADDDVMFVGTDRLWRTNNFFNSATPTWSINGPAITGSNSSNAVRTVAFPTSDSSCNTYAFGGSDGFLRLTTSGGASWSDLGPSRSVPGRAVTALRFAPSDSNVAYVTLSGFDEGTPGRPGHVFKSTNARSGSPSWTNVTPPVNIPFNIIVVDSKSSSTVFAGADNGVWASDDAGATWAYLGADAGLPNTAVFDQENPGLDREGLRVHLRTRRLRAHATGQSVRAPMPVEPDARFCWREARVRDETACRFDAEARVSVGRQR